MKLISKLLGRGHAAPSKHSDAAGHIARALTAAGLDGDAHSGVRETIDRALTDAGLMGPRQAGSHGAADRSLDVAAPAGSQSGTGKGEFQHATYANAHGRRDYRLYLPLGYSSAGAPRPLLMMLHGCTQTPEDFAAGTRMNALADEHGFIVAYPQQVAKANHARCWNWFRGEDQRGDAGEPSILAGIARQIATDHRVDPARIFVAGLSAGAAMAVVLGHTHADLFRAIGVHSGLPYASAHDVPSALARMQGRASNRAGAPSKLTVPMILFHGDTDRTVVPANADALMNDAARPGTRASTETAHVTGGHRYTRERQVDDTGAPWLERWTVHGSGHAWSGGDIAGTYTDPAGPDASAQMVRFFLELPVAHAESRVALGSGS